MLPRRIAFLGLGKLTHLGLGQQSTESPINSFVPPALPSCASLLQSAGDRPFPAAFFDGLDSLPALGLSTVQSNFSAVPTMGVPFRALHNILITFLLMELHCGLDAPFSLHNLVNFNSTGAIGWY